MKNRTVIKRLMVLGLVCSLAFSVTPLPAMAAENETQTESEKQTEETETQTETQKETSKETESPVVKPQESETKKETEKPKETETQKAEEKPEEKKETEAAVPGKPVKKTAKTAENIGSLVLSGEGIQKDVDYAYDSVTGTLTIKTNKKMSLSGSGTEMEGTLVIEAEEANLTLENVTFKNKTGNALVVNEKKKLNLTLMGSSKFLTEKEDMAAAKIEMGAEISVEGEGKVEFSGKGTGKDLSMSRGNAKEDVPSVLKLKDGTVKALNGISVTGTEADKKVKVSITGGNTDITTGSDSSKIEVTGAEDTKKVYRSELTLEDADKQVEGLTVSVAGTPYDYGNKGIYTNADKKVFLYLPEGKAEVKVGNAVYAAEIKTDGTAKFVKVEAVLSADAITIPEAVYGYTPSAETIVIKNTAAAPTNVKAELQGTDADKFTLVTPADVTVPAGTESTPGKNEQFKISPKEQLGAGTYQAELVIKGDERQNVTIKVSFTVKKAKLVPKAKIDKKVYDGTTAATGKVTLTGAVAGENPKLKDTVTYKFNSKNVKDATTVTVSNLELDADSAKNYELTETEIKVKASIAKAPNEKKNEKPRTPVIKPVYDSTTHKWHLEMTTYEGQEYLFFGKVVTKLTSVNLKSKNWAYGTKKTVTDHVIPLTISEGTTYTVWTRYAGDDNHEAGTELAYGTVTPKQAPKTYSTSDNKITGITAGTSYKTNSVLAFRAEGAGMDNKNPNEGDERYLPISWKVSESHTWSAAPYEASFKMPSTGSYTLYVTFRKQTYDGSKWVDSTTTSVSSVSFKVSADGVNGTGLKLSGGSTTTGKPSPASAAKTGDDTPILPMIAVFLAAGIVLAGYLFSKKRKK